MKRRDGGGRRLRAVPNRALVLAAALAGAIGGCGVDQEAELWGDLEASYSLDFERIRAYYLGPDLIIIYEGKLMRPIGDRRIGKQVRNQVARLTLRTDRLELVAGESLRFDANANEDGIAGGQMDRYVVQEDEKKLLVQQPNFPDVAQGTVRFDELGKEPGERLVGDFECTFVNTRTLRGAFSVDLIEG